MAKHVTHFRSIDECKTIEDFRSTGKIVDAKLFTIVRPQEELHADCTDVVTYAGGIYIEMLKSGSFYYRGAIGNCELLEQGIWDLHKTQK